MIDINLIRNEPEKVKKNLEKRKDFEKLVWVDDLIEKDKKQRELQIEIDRLRQERNRATEEIREAKKKGEKIDDKVKAMKELPEKIKKLEDELEEIKIKIKFYMMQLPNIMHESVPYGKDDSENVEIRKWGIPRKKEEFGFDIVNHAELIEALDIGDFSRATKIAGKGFYYLSGDLARLSLAIINYSVDFLSKRGYKFVIPPYMINRDVINAVTDYEFFKEMVYKVEEEDLHLIGTSEHPIMGMYMEETIPEAEMPKRFVGYSQCFRKEIGSHGVDEKGLFRVHQFQKVEQVIICRPEESWDMHEELLKNTEDMMKELGLAYRVVNICTGDLGIVASKKYDIEAWLPRQGKYREVASCSNCTDYQTRRLNIRYGTPGAPKNPLAHSLNNTAIALSRTMIAIIENYQDKDGNIVIPEVLRPYMGGKVKIAKN